MANPRPIHEMEAKWQRIWDEQGTYRATEPNAAPNLQPDGSKFYGLVEFPYPSGEGLHVGHPRSYTAIDIVTRKRRMEGQNALYPMGWDAFGLPTENFAIKHHVRPQDATAKNVANFRRQLKSLGFGFDWSREINTTDPAYYKWTQWQFLQFFKHGLAYKGTSLINWCPKDKIGLANEEVANGCCERCGTQVEKREKSQWMIAITKYADRLIADLDSVDYLPQVKAQQVNWIGRSEGARIRFPVTVSESDSPLAANFPSRIEVFTTRPDTLFGATFLAISPETANGWIEAGWQPTEEVRAYVSRALTKREEERASGAKEYAGVASGMRAENPANGERIPIWIADYVLGHYGTGAIMAVPAHDERDFAFARRNGLPMKMVVCPHYPKTTCPILEEAFVGEGHAVGSDFLDGSSTAEAKEKMIAWLEKHENGVREVTYKLRDWVFSRQRYWGEPIPIVICPGCGYVPVPDDQLPVTLPEVEAYEPTDTGESPLAKIRDWVETPCPKCGAKAERETDTMPNWAGSSWYFLRYCDPQNERAPASPEKLRYWMPVDLYNGGMEHTTLHLLYSRFWYKFLWDIGIVPKDCGSEPYAKRRSHGLILGEGGEKMSKSKGNVVNPDDMVSKYGADGFRVYMMFMGPFDQPVPWDANGIEGVKRFLDKVWGLFTSDEAETHIPNRALETLYHQTVKKITEGIESMQFNTCVSQLMILANAYQEAGGIPDAQREGYLKILAPFAPHLAEEIWRNTLESKTSVHACGGGWPAFDSSKLQAANYELVVQVNGKVRDRITVPSDISEADAKSAALASANVQAHLSGKTPRQIIYVAGRLVNVVTSE